MPYQIVGIFSNPLIKQNQKASGIGHVLSKLYRRALCSKANPRSIEYMKNAFIKRYPNGVFVNTEAAPTWERDIATAHSIILLYPDSIGLGFSRIESEVFRSKKRLAAVRALNGRDREFILNNSAIIRLRSHRFLERWMIGEIFALLIFLIITPVLLVADWLRGRT